MIEDWVKFDKSQRVQIGLLIVEVFLSWIFVPLIQASYPTYPGELIFKWALTLQFVIVIGPTILHFVINFLIAFEHAFDRWYARWRDAQTARKLKEERESKLQETVKTTVSAPEVKSPVATVMPQAVTQPTVSDPFASIRER